jgi:hypothetical protein
MNETVHRSLESGLLSGTLGLDWATLIVLLIVAVIYVAAPALGYAPYSRGLLLGALWLLLIKLILEAVRVGVTYFLVTTSASSSRDLAESLYLVLGLLESGLFLVALILFVAGLAALRRVGEIER